MTATILRLGSPARRNDAGFLSLLADWRQRRRYRAELRRLLRTGHYLVEDIGLAVPAAVREAVLPLWR